VCDIKIQVVVHRKSFLCLVFVLGQDERFCVMLERLGKLGFSVSGAFFFVSNVGPGQSMRCVCVILIQFMVQMSLSYV